MKTLSASWLIRLDKLRRRPLAHWVCLAEAYVLLGVMRAAILGVRFERIAAWLGLSARVGTPIPLTEQQTSQAELVSWALHVAAPRTLWQSACLAQSLACASMLRRRRIPGILYLGLTRNPEPGQPFLAHAWLRSGAENLVGGKRIEQYSVVAAFSTLPDSIIIPAPEN